VIQAPRLASALRRLASRPMQHADPLSRLPAPVAPLARKVTLPGPAGMRLYEMRESLYAPPPFSATWRLKLPPGGRLTFQTTSLGPATFSVEVVRKDEVRRVAAGPMRGRGPGPWTLHEVDLSAFSNEEVGLCLRTEGPGPHAFFGAPRLYGRADDAPPSIVFIVVDALSADVVGFTGSDRQLTPELDRLAEEGVAFLAALTNANWTRASTLSFFASEYSTRLGINVHSWWLDPGRRRELYRRFHGLLPELLKRAGYASAAIVNNLFILGYHSAGVEMGFEEISDFRTEVRDTPDITAFTRDFLRRHRDRPFFLFVNYNSPHHPYTPPARYLRRVDRPEERLHPELRGFLGEVAFADDHVGRIVRSLEELGLRERTLVVVTADHGEGLREDLAYINVAIQRYSRFTHTVNLYDEVMRVPLVFSRPADLPKGRRVPSQVRLLDLAPTILSLVGLPPHPQHRGVDLAPLLYGEGELKEPLPAFTEGKKCSALRFKGYKYIRREPGFDIISRRREGFRPRRVPEELYRIETDPRELHDLTGTEPEVLAEMREAHRRWRDELALPLAPAGFWSAMPVGTTARPGAPVAPDPVSAQPQNRRARTHLLVAGDGRPRRVAGSLFVRGRVSSFRMLETETDDAVWLAKPDRLDFSFRVAHGQDRLWVETEPPGADLRLQVMVDGQPLAPGQLLLGPWGLPLVDPPQPLKMAEIGSLLVAGGPPPRRPGVDFGVFLWQEGSVGEAPAPGVSEEPGVDPGEPTALDREVENALKGWGYIQKGDKVLR
jgi:arylsulfatase A-like enzyme